MRYVILYGRIYALTQEMYEYVLRCLRDRITFNLTDIGTIPQILDISTITPRQAIELLEKEYKT